MVMEKLTALLAEHLDMDASEIKADTTFETLGIDSLDTVEMVMQLEEELNVELELDEKVATVGELAAFIEKKLS
ncbi:MAG: phosphopantetheine-binding protein [Oscillospiraceae bacterium]|nr:phosphopantetheine-binding protein [Oscillospiraceae bacterium]